nr:hypothetical protein [uncultured Steroidobacter sp.]
MNRLDASQVEAGGEIARSPRSPSFPQPTTAAEVARVQGAAQNPGGEAPTGPIDRTV